jgi:hypothetical protein
MVIGRFSDGCDGPLDGSKNDNNKYSQKGQVTTKKKLKKNNQNFKFFPRQI